MPKLPRAALAGRPHARRAITLLVPLPWLAALPASAEKWPDRSITLIVPFAAGGASDVSSRIMAEVMSKHLGQSVIIENAAGAGGATGSLRGKNAKPDGYTIGFAHMGTHAASVSTNPKLPYDPRTDFDYLGIHLVTPNIMIVRKDFPADTLQEFVAYAKAKGKDLKMGHNGAGSLAHLTCVFFFQLAGVEPTYVVYRGFGQTINDILSGSIDGTCELIASAREYVVAGRSRGSGSRLPSARRCCRTCQPPRKAACPNSLPRAGWGSMPPRAFRRRSWPSCARRWRLHSSILWCKRGFPRSAAPFRRRRTAAATACSRSSSGTSIRWGEVVKKAGGIEAK